MDVPVAPAPDLTQPLVLVARPASQTTPLVFASPHSGRCYPAEFLDASRLDAFGLRRSEDSFVEELFSAAIGSGAPLIHATFPRAWCDPNREQWELDPAMFADELPSWVNTTSARVTAGLGTIARVVGSGEAIYQGKLLFADAEQRILSCWKPFHETLVALVNGTRAVFGQCVLIDCHSMPSHIPVNGKGDRLADIVLGDAHGTSCAPYIIRFVERRLVDLGYRVRRNDPYAGGFITRHYGRPRENVHALQIEIARDLYMDETKFERSAGFTETQRDLTVLIEALAAEASRLCRH
ncbi:MAG: N-formylglutamate amidohydrolase [Acetobacteraceae bacterium]|nr:N-formylglutamate amidohydrolase [Acetobacteraceae bacterium]